MVESKGVSVIEGNAEQNAILQEIRWSKRFAIASSPCTNDAFLMKQSRVAPKEYRYGVQRLSIANDSLSLLRLLGSLEDEQCWLDGELETVMFEGTLGHPALSIPPGAA